MRSWGTWACFFPPCHAGRCYIHIFRWWEWGGRCCRLPAMVSDNPLLILLCAGIFSNPNVMRLQWQRPSNTVQTVCRQTTAAVHRTQAHGQVSHWYCPPFSFSPPSLWNSSFVRDNVQVVNMKGARGRGSRSRSIYTGKHEERICCDAAVWLNIGATLWSCGWSRMQIIRHRYRGTVWRLIDKMRVGSWRSWWLWLVLLWCSSQFEVQTKTGRGVSASEPDRSHFFLHTFQSRTFWSHWIGH